MLITSLVWGSRVVITSDLWAAESAVLRVFDVAGRELYLRDFLILKETYALNLSFLILGVYIIFIQTGGFVKIEQVMII
jgi:hypothetical protein